MKRTFVEGKFIPAWNFKNENVQDFLGNQWLEFCAPSAGGPGLFPGQRNRSQHAATKTQCSQITKLNFYKKENLGLRIIFWNFKAER